MKYSQTKLKKQRLFPLGISTDQVKFHCVQDTAGKITSVEVQVKNRKKSFKVNKLNFLKAFKEAETFLKKNLVLTKGRGKNNLKKHA